MLLSPREAKNDLEASAIASSNAAGLNLLTGQKLLKTWLRNYRTNLPAMWAGKDIFSLNYAETSAIIIGNGPSLRTYRQLDTLAESDYKGCVLCTDSAVAAAHQAGVRVDFIVNIDADEKAAAFVLSSSIVVPLLLSAFSKPALANWKGGVYWFVPDIGYCDMSHYRVADALSDIAGKTLLSSGGNVGTAAIMVAHAIGCTPIALIGMDMSFEVAAGPRSSPYWQVISNQLGAEGAEKMFAKRRNPDWDNEYLIDYVFDAYRQLLLDRVRLLGIDLYNCSEQGAIHAPYIKAMRFEEFLKKHPS